MFDQLRVTTELPERCGVVQEITLYKGLPRIDLRTTLSKYRGEHELLALAFPLAISGGTPTFEDRFAAVVRKRSRGRFDFRTLEGRNPSGCGLGAAQNWVDVGPTSALHIMCGKRRAGSVPLGPCAIISPRDLKHRAVVRSIERALLSRGVTCTHWLETDDLETDTGNCAFRISLGRDNAYSQKVLSAHPEASAKLADALADRPWGGVLVSRPDPQGQSPDVPVLVADTADPKGMPHLAEAIAADIQADSMQISEACDLSGAAEPCDDHGVALINRGSLAASLEQDGTLVSLLFHTAPWNAMPWGEGKLSHFFVPEHKTHVFEHSLLSHPGDWRRGGVVRAGHEVNNPLIACQTPVSSGSLPAELGLVSSDVPNLVIAAVKPLGNPLAEHHDRQCSDPGRGIVLRAYEAEGRPTQATLRFAAEPQEAWLANLLEKRTADATITRPGWRRPAEVLLDVPACGIVTLGSRLARLAEQARPSARGGSAEELGPCAELSRATHCRYWDHNVGAAAPIGNQPVTVWMAGDLPLGQNTRFSLGVSNDSRDREISGTVEVIAPSEWTLIPRQIPFRIPAASQAVFEVMVIVPADASPQFLRAVVRDGERELQDVLPIGDIRPLEATLARGDDGYVARLANPNPDYVEGQLALITPVESWGESVDSLALSSVTPRLHCFRLDAGEESTFAFTVRGHAEGLWAVAKVMWYGRVQYVQEPRLS